jgi:hypothetical protein
VDAGAKVELIPEQFADAGALLLKYDKLALQPGNYAIMQQDSVLQKISFNLPETESKLANFNPDDLEQKLSESGMSWMRIMKKASVDRIRADIQSGQTGVPLWKYFILFAVVCLFGEIMILKLIKS